MVHFAVDDQEVRFCTQLKGKASWFLPFNQGWNDGAGNPPNPDGLKTDYLWKRILTPRGSPTSSRTTPRSSRRRTRRPARRSASRSSRAITSSTSSASCWPTPRKHGAGKRYLIQHSAGSGKSNSIAWLAHQLIGLEQGRAAEVFDSIIVVTDRRILDKQIRDTIKQFAQVGATVGHAEHSGDLRRFIESGKKIIISTVQKFPFILDEIGDEHRGRKFAIIIDEAHSSQGGTHLGGDERGACRAGRGRRRDDEDSINRIMEARKMLPNASYFAFTATPKNKTLEIFGEPYHEGGTGQAPALPQLHDEAGDPGGLHPRRAARTTRRSTATTS